MNSRPSSSNNSAPDSEDSSWFEGEYRRRIFAWAAEQVRGEFRPATWNAFWWTGVEGHDPRAAAKALGMSVGAVYIARSRVMARLKRETRTVWKGSRWTGGLSDGGPSVLL